MPTYEFRCRRCGATFEEKRPMAEASAPAVCPDGHRDTVRLLSVFAAARSGGGVASQSGGGSGGGGGCCGGGCGCR